ncbi:MAG TPA: glycine oxidase ThiO [Thermomicrobiaceae bacterium]|nr:glycine oxidase ThiO [Thermomicrobiaceae bacterium]
MPAGLAEVGGESGVGMQAFDVVIVGGGLLGAAVAYELARRGQRVAIVERGPIGGEASWASAGIISYPNRLNMPRERVEITRRSRERYPALVEQLESETGVAIEYQRPGNLLVAVDEAGAAEVNRLAEWQQSLGFRVESLDPEAARRLEPALTGQLTAAWFAPDVGALRVQRLTEALAMAASRRGAAIMSDVPVEEVTHEGTRVTGVRTTQGLVPGGTVVLAAGAWTGGLSQSLGIDLPTRPVKGQLIAFAGAPTPPSHIISGRGGYILPRLDGTVTAAATEEEAGFDRRVTGEAVAWLIDLAGTLCPSLPRGELVSSWTGLRPATADGEPIMGPVPGYEGLWVAAGHFRTGAKEAPASAELVATSLLSGRVDPLLQPFLPSRFNPGGTQAS